MRTYIRTRIPGATYFFTVTLEDRSSTVLIDRVDALRSAFQRVMSRHPFTVDAIAILPEHLHAVWTLPADDDDYPMRWMLVKQAFTRALAARHPARGTKGERAVWQRRYWEHLIRDEDDLRRHVDYIHFNPVKHGHTQRAADWPHSSFHRYVRAGRLPANWGIAAPGEGKFGE